MSEMIHKLLLVIPINEQQDLEAVVESEGLQTIKDLFKKTNTSYNTHWNGNYVLDQDEIPWKADQEEMDCLSRASGKVVVINDGKYYISEKLNLFADTDGSMYVMESDVEEFIS